MIFAPLLIPTVFSLAMVAGEPPAPRVHADEIRAFAYAVTISSMASDVCSGILINTTMLEEMRTRYHIAEADGPALGSDRQAIGQELFEKMAHAENRQAWCDATYRSYGPGGGVLPNLMKH